MRRFVTLSILLLFAVPFGASISGCAKSDPVVYCNGGDSGVVAGQATSISLRGAGSTASISLNFAQITQSSSPSPQDCKGQSAAVGPFTYSTTDMTIADVEPSTGKICGGTWNRNSGGGIPDYTVCNPTNKTGTAYLTASADGVTSNPVPMFVHPVVTSIVLGADSSAGSNAPLTAAVTAYNIVSNTPTLTARNSFKAGDIVSLYGFPSGTFKINGNDVNNAVVQSANLSNSQFTVSIPGFTHADISAVENGYAGAPDCTTNPTTACCPLPNIGSASAQTYVPNSCVSQGQTRQLAARVYTGTGANISCQIGQLIYTDAESSLVTIDSNGVATAARPGSVIITAFSGTASSSAGLFSTCPPVSITLSAPGQSPNGTVVVNQNNTQPLIVTAQDAYGVPLTNLNLQYQSTAPNTVPTSLASITPSFAGAASISAVCQPPSCNPSALTQIGLFGNGTPITSNSITAVTPGTNSTVLYMASTQSPYVSSRDFTQPSLSASLLLPYLPNSMVINNGGSLIFMGSATALMVINANSTLSIASVNPGAEGTVLALSPDGQELVISDPRKGTTSITSSSGGVISSYGGVGTRAQFSPDGQTAYIAAGNQILVYSNFSGWTSITPPTLIGPPITDVAVTVPAVGAYFAGQTTSAVSYCPISTLIAPQTESNTFYPLADTSSAMTDRIAATNDGLHILGATVTPAPMLNDLRVEVPATNANGPSHAGGISGVSLACPPTGTLTFSNTVAPTTLTGVTASAITGVVPTPDSSEVFVTYTGSGGLLPAYAPAPSGAGTIHYVKLSGTATAPVAGVSSADSTTFYTGTSGDNLVHIINRATLTDTSTLAPNLIDSGGNTVPVNLFVQKPRTAN